MTAALPNRIPNDSSRYRTGDPRERLIVALDVSTAAAAQKILAALESELGWKLEFKPQLKVYPTLDTYRDATGQPGWIAAFTRGKSQGYELDDRVRALAAQIGTHVDLARAFVQLQLQAAVGAGAVDSGKRDRGNLDRGSLDEPNAAQRQSDATNDVVSLSGVEEPTTGTASDANGIGAADEDGGVADDGCGHGGSPPQTRSRTVAMPCPPPMHWVASA